MSSLIHGYSAGAYRQKCWCESTRTANGYSSEGSGRPPAVLEA